MPAVDPPTPHARRRLRADAERNREAIIRAAGTVFAEQGGGVDVREIARRSGVGMGTLYRHFPTKGDLLTTVLEQEFISWITAAEEASAAIADPWQALTVFFEQSLAHLARNRALVEGCADVTGPFPQCARRRIDVMNSLRLRCQEAGLLRPDVTTDDLVLLSMSLSQAVQAAGSTAPWRRLLQISLDGLSSRNGDPLPDYGPAAETSDAQGPPGRVRPPVP
ncbi:TetR/AcrR family transcriptional regulator [Streptomyces fuscigenes]|uniref:TetR/AcrR family transcriptional regulator n=1 Tax=Streptomyces fuscigenes TaxID=1528880 RepID=UPI001F2DC9EB|nr:TetR/AcrR family transcriptional regulator [Streptomyces fuscigenes]MCF3963773.1 TetR/AcrR family transcriptional regulator [Streptomyces fuscigenes]